MRNRGIFVIEGDCTRTTVNTPPPFPGLRRERGTWAEGASIRYATNLGYDAIFLAKPLGGFEDAKTSERTFRLDPGTWIHHEIRDD